MEHGHQHHIEPLESPKEYFKFAAIIAAIVLASFVLSSTAEWSFRQFLDYFMGSFLVVFAAFKLISIEMFSLTYRSYDIIAKRLPAWGYVFPFVELFLGLSYLLSDGPAWLNLSTLIITGTASIGVWQEVTKKSKIMCACLGTVIRLPLSKVSLVEDVLMFVMALAMLAI